MLRYKLLEKDIIERKYLNNEHKIIASSRSKNLSDYIPMTVVVHTALATSQETLLCGFERETCRSRNNNKIIENLSPFPLKYILLKKKSVFALKLIVAPNISENIQTIFLFFIFKKKLYPFFISLFK